PAGDRGHGAHDRGGNAPLLDEERGDQLHDRGLVNVEGPAEDTDRQHCCAVFRPALVRRQRVLRNGGWRCSGRHGAFLPFDRSSAVTGRPICRLRSAARSVFRSSGTGNKSLTWSHFPTANRVTSRIKSGTGPGKSGTGSGSSPGQVPDQVWDNTL